MPIGGLAGDYIMRACTGTFVQSTFDKLNMSEIGIEPHVRKGMDTSHKHASHKGPADYSCKSKCMGL